MLGSAKIYCHRLLVPVDSFLLTEAEGTNGTIDQQPFRLQAQGGGPSHECMQLAAGNGKRKDGKKRDGVHISIDFLAAG